MPNEQVVFSDTEQRMLTVLSDCQPHKIMDLHACLEDKLGPTSNVHAHLTSIRKKIRPLGQTILHERIDGVGYFRHVRLIANSQ